MENFDTILEAIERYLPAIISFITLLANHPWAAAIAGAVLSAIGGTAVWWTKRKRKDVARDRRNADLQRDLDDLEQDSTSADRSIRDRMRNKRK